MVIDNTVGYWLKNDWFQFKQLLLPTSNNVLNNNLKTISKLSTNALQRGQILWILKLKVANVRTPEAAERDASSCVLSPDVSPPLSARLLPGGQRNTGTDSKSNDSPSSVRGLAMFTPHRWRKRFLAESLYVHFLVVFCSDWYLWLLKEVKCLCWH